MSTEKTEALVIRQTDFSETSKVVTLFTRDFGKVSALAKGARRLKGPFEAAIDLLTACRIVFIRKSTDGLDILTEAQVISRFRPNGRDLVRLYGGYYVAELLNGLTEEYDPHPRLFDESLTTLKRLVEAPDPKLGPDPKLAPDPKLVIVRFELAVLREIGQLPAFDACVVCGRDSADDTTWAFWVSQGGLICRDCQKERYEQNRVQAGTVALLQRLSDESDAALERLVVSAEQLTQMRRVLTAAISNALGRRPSMTRYLNL